MTHDDQQCRATGDRDGAALPIKDPGVPPVVVATRFVVRRRRHTLPFLRAAWVAGREAEAIPGFLGGTILADLWNRRFWTVSVWASPDAVRSYGSAPGHAKAMRQTAVWASEAEVQRWRASTSEAPPFAEIARRFGVTAPQRALVRQLQPAIGTGDPKALPQAVHRPGTHTRHHQHQGVR